MGKTWNIQTKLQYFDIGEHWTESHFHLVFIVKKSDHSWAHGHYGFNVQTRYLVTIDNGTHGYLTPRRGDGQW